MDLADKIRKIEALIASSSSEGERRAAELAKQRLQEKTVAAPVEYAIRTDGLWKKRLFMALCQKHGLSAYHYRGQKRTTTMVRVAKPFMDQILWPEYSKYAQAKGIKVIVLVEAEFDAMLIQQCAADLCCCMAIGGVGRRPDLDADRLLRGSDITLFALDYDDAGKKAYKFWKDTYFQLKAWPVPREKSPGDALIKGVNLREWVLAGTATLLRKNDLIAH